MNVGHYKKGEDISKGLRYMSSGSLGNRLTAIPGTRYQSPLNTLQSRRSEPRVTLSTESTCSSLSGISFHEDKQETFHSTNKDTVPKLAESADRLGWHAVPSSARSNTSFPVKQLIFTPRSDASFVSTPQVPRRKTRVPIAKQGLTQSLSKSTVRRSGYDAPTALSSLRDVRNINTHVLSGASQRGTSVGTMSAADLTQLLSGTLTDRRGIGGTRQGIVARRMSEKVSNHSRSSRKMLPISRRKSAPKLGVAESNKSTYGASKASGRSPVRRRQSSRPSRVGQSVSTPYGMMPTGPSSFRHLSKETPGFREEGKMLGRTQRCAWDSSTKVSTSKFS